MPMKSSNRSLRSFSVFTESRRALYVLPVGELYGQRRADQHHGDVMLAARFRFPCARSPGPGTVGFTRRVDSCWATAMTAQAFWSVGASPSDSNAMKMSAAHACGSFELHGQNDAFNAPARATSGSTAGTRGALEQETR